MKKALKLFIILFLSLTLASCTMTVNKSGLKTSQIKKYALEAKEYAGENYQVTGTLLSFSKNASAINCAGSNLGYYRTEEGSTDVSIANVMTNEVVANNIKASRVSTSGEIHNYYNGIMYSNNLPIVIVENATEDSSTISFYDCYGKFIYTTEPFELAVNLSFGGEKRLDKIHKFYLTLTGGIEQTIYFTYQVEDYKYQVSLSNEAIYNSSAEFEWNTLITVKNKRGKAIAYFRFEDDKIIVLNKKMKLLNTVDLDAYNMEGEEPILLEDRIIFYAQEEYYKNLNERSSKPTYKCRSLEINLKNGKVKYNDNWKYIIHNVITLGENFNEEDVSYQGKPNLVVFSKLNKKGEVEDIKRCVIMTKRASFRGSRIYDGMTNIIKLDKKNYFVAYDDISYILNRNGLQAIKDVIGLEICANGMIRYRSGDNYYLSSGNTIIDDLNNGTRSHYFVSSKIYNNKNIIIDYQNDSYIANGLTFDSNYLSYAYMDMFITTDNRIFVDDKLIYTFEGKTVTSNSRFIDLNDHKIFKFVFSDDSVIYFNYEVRPVK